MIYDLSWWVVLAAIIPGYLIQNCIHEVSHGLTLLPWGWTFTIHPYPLFMNDTTDTRHFALTRLSWFIPSKRPEGEQISFYFALCEYQDNGKPPPSKAGWAVCDIAPRISNIVFIVGSFVAYKLIGMPQWGSTLLAVFVACNLIDYLTAFGIFWGKRRDTDIWYFQESSGVNLWVLRVLVGLTFGILLALLLVP